MNPEVQYPELKTMKDSEMFVEWAIITRPSGGYLKLFLKKIILQKERNALVKALKMEYGIKEDPDILPDFDYVQLITIYR